MLYIINASKTKQLNQKLHTDKHTHFLSHITHEYIFERRQLKLILLSACSSLISDTARVLLL